MIITFKGLISNLKIYKALKYIILNTLGIDSPPIHTKIKVFQAMWTKNVKFQHTLIILRVHQYM